MELELIRGVCYPKLQKRLLQEKDREIDNLVGIADRCQQAFDMGSVLDNGPRLELDSDVVDVRKMAPSAYKNRNSSKWSGERGSEGQQERPQGQDHRSMGQPQSGENCKNCGSRGGCAVHLSSSWKVQQHFVSP